MESPVVELVNVSRRFSEIVAVERISLSIQRGEFFSLLGPSGCGKTTILRLIAGLDAPDSGSVNLNGTDATTIPAHRRPVNTVFQSYALFPHLNVWENIAFGLRMKKVARAEIVERVRRVVELTRISELADRVPAQLSGGQKQRVALARAIVNEPQVLLLDEPLGALDLQLRKELQVELHALQRRLGITFVYVTHDQEEALAMSDRVAVMNAGRIEQLGSAEALYERPRTRFVAQFLGSCNLVEAIVRTNAEGRLRVETAFGEIEVCAQTSASSLSPGTKCTFALRPEKISLLSPSASNAPNCLRARVADAVYTGAETRYRLEAQGGSLSACALNAGGATPAFRVGEEVQAHLPPSGLVLLDD